LSNSPHLMAIFLARDIRDELAVCGLRLGSVLGFSHKSISAYNFTVFQ
jgi:hypothetical protein